MSDNVIIQKGYENGLMFKVVTPREIINSSQNIDISTITLKSEEYIGDDDKTIKYLYTDLSNPLVIEKTCFSDSSTLYINPDWYINNRALADNLIGFISRKTKSKSFSINNKILINPNLIEKICSNQYIEEVSLCRFQDYGYVLKEKDYKAFKSSKITCVYSSSLEERLLDNFDPIIGYNKDRNLIAHYRYNDLIKTQSVLYLIDPLKKEEIDNLKYISDGVSIILSNDSVDSAIQVLNKLNRLGKKNQILLRNDDKNKINDVLMQLSFDYENLNVQPGLYQVPYLTYIRMEKILDKMIEPARSFSPFEKFIYAYNLTKRFKDYKENNENLNSARNIYALLENEYMVCVGFSNMLGELCKKLGIETINLFTCVDVSYDGVGNEYDLNKSVPVKKGHHSRRCVYLKDEKYGINGYYISDPTWDNNIENDYYNYMLLTSIEEVSTKRYTFTTYDSIDELFNVTCIEEFYKKINFMVNKQYAGLSKSNIITKYDVLNDILFDLVNKMRMLDSSFIDKLSKEFPVIKEKKYDWKGDNTYLLSRIGSHIVEMITKEVTGNIIMEGVHNVYKLTNLFGDKTEEEFEITKERNRERQITRFPKRYKEYENGNSDIYDNAINKFDLEEKHVSL